MTQNKPIQQIRIDSIEQCLKHYCIDCSDSYINRLTEYKLKSKRSCHNKKSLEQQALGLECSNIHHTQSCQQHGVLSDDLYYISQPKHKSFVENSWLWTGESTNCICTHHVEMHCTVRCDHIIIIRCHGMYGDNEHCNCKLFTPYSVKLDSCYFKSNERKNMSEPKYEL